MLRVKAAYRMLANASISRLKALAARPPAHAPAALLVIRAALAQHAGDLRRCIALLQRAVGQCNASELPYAADALGATYVLLEDRAALAALLQGLPTSGPLEGPHIALRALLAAMDGDVEECRECIETCKRIVELRDDRIIGALTLQRVALASYHIGDGNAALAQAMQAVRLGMPVRAYCVAARAYAIACEVHHSIVGDPHGAREYAESARALADASADLTLETSMLALRCELAAAQADAMVLDRCKEKLRQRFTGLEHRERVAVGVADLLQRGWAGDFAGVRAAAALRLESLRCRGDRALCIALLAAAEAAGGDVCAARRFSRLALSLTDLRSLRGDTPAEARYLRIAHLLASSVCIIIGDIGRGTRALRARSQSQLQGSAMLVDVAAGAPWEEAPLAIRGYARLVASTLDASRAAGAGGTLTRTELLVLRMLAGGMNAPEIARETARSVHTVRAHARSIIAKLGVRGRYAAICEARNLGLIA